MRYLRWSVLSVVALALGACTTTLNPGRCNHDSDCSSGQVCNLAPTIQGDGRCVSPSSLDGGGDVGTTDGGADAANDGEPDANTCAGCGGSTPLCLQGSCVQCLASSDCNGDRTKPICDTTAHTCTACSSDSQCVAKFGSAGNPGICMSQIDGHCATDAETVYVQNVAGCTATYVNDQGGTSTAPYCSMDPIGLAANDTHSLVVVRGTVAAGSWTYARGTGHPETSIVGQQTAAIASSTSPGFNMSSGLVYIRAVKFSPSASQGISATGGTLQLDTVVVDSCQGGGILLNGAAFDISNTTVTNNGPGQQGTTFWGGIFVNAPPATGPAQLNLVTIQGNNQIGLDCSTGIQGSGVFATGNTGGVDVSPSCNITTCASPGAGCGAP
jgi:hypothetical protein